VRSREKEGGTGPERFSTEMSMERMKRLDESQETPAQLVQRSVEAFQLESELEGSERRDLAVSKAASSERRLAALTSTERTERRRRKRRKRERIAFSSSSFSIIFALFFWILCEIFGFLFLGSLWEEKGRDEERGDFQI
jgi:ABC-type Na+ efflux pump permease subunit